jgi:hypothetical protein
VAPQGIRRVGELAALLIEKIPPRCRHWLVRPFAPCSHSYRHWTSRSRSWRQPSSRAIETTRQAVG